MLCEKAVDMTGGLPLVRGFLATLYALNGDEEKARGICEELVQDDDLRHGTEPFIAAIYEALGEKDEAMNWLERALHVRAPFVTAVGTEWLPLESLRDDSRYITLRYKIGMAVGLGGPLPPD